MRVDTLGELKTAFDEWRRSRANMRVPIPSELAERALRAAKVHGTAAVRGATKISCRRLVMKPRGPRARQRARIEPAVVPVPAYSRIALSAAGGASQPIAEVETPSGTKLRIFAATSEMLALVGALCSKGDTP